MAIENLITEHIDVWTSAVKTRSTSGRGSSKKLELYGIKKLRELILELAVRGKLVPQDPNDEPASVLLERIAAEKSLLVKEKKIKKQKSLGQVSQEELFDTPTGWAWTRISEIAEIGPRNSTTDDDTEVSFVPMPLITTNYDGSHGSEKRIWKEIKKGYTHFQDGDIALAKITPCFENSKAAVFSGLEGGVGAGTTELHVARPLSDCINPLFVLLYLKAPIFLKVGETKMTGSAGQKRVPKDFFAENPLPFPPSAEQHRIIAKVDELMTLCDQLEQQTEDSIEAHQVLVTTLLDTLTNSADADALMQNWARISEHFDTLFTTEESIDQLKQTILQLAVMGKLVPQDPSDEPAAELLKRIAEEKAQLVKENKIKKQKALPPISQGEKPFELPSGWEWCRLGDLELSSEAGWSPKCLDTPRSEDNWGVLKVSAVTWNQYNPMENKELPNSLAPREHLEVQDGDFLISRANTADLVAKAVIVPNDSPTHLMMSDKIIRFRFSDKVSSHYINLFNNSQFARNYYSQVAGGTSSSMKNVSREQIKNLLICLPPVATQTAIIDIVGCFFDICEQLKQKVQENQITQFQLTDTIVEQAV
ncbi:restriction endonuclease subunit S [Vibrio metschnikovii]|uniref:Restriction endonuclease subunit S n=1 Tax=bacterium 19PA01SH03 TaxID=2920705 RepID=A0AAU6STC1_UNCXX|nr:restriction endonuclease subunit S [Vibrio metschnikovii]EKO3647991.1 restriction endonuclease subunit S [Vibrio metschnikovii]EKO3699831.1 restriction endonuclease subunit S [Vibrio metschnikovii]EKO3740746.1 restriction endonuclease subunit S [Vibrio metschnikovii]EKO3749373.1 restriction endonuclease subunit S [Vibrio metschnikovii]